MELLCDLYSEINAFKISELLPYVNDIRADIRTYHALFEQVCPTRSRNLSLYNQPLVPLRQSLLLLRQSPYS